MDFYSSLAPRLEAAERRARIDWFTDYHGLVQRTYSHGDRTLLLLDRPKLQSVDESRINGYLAQHAVAESIGIGTNCFNIAYNMNFDKRASGRMFTYLGAEALCGFSDHCINYDELADGTAVGIDLTASVNIDREQGNFDVLALRAANVNALSQAVGELYGGDWRTVKVL
ncbi:MAG TPA: hypothetical protein VGO07_05440 [Candidatus Saccharimonadales bacterium]|jgi:hypothetical protein|nr:hypothetical protein [Candidatus Saccharimonadales bacterium]